MNEITIPYRDDARHPKVLRPGNYLLTPSDNGPRFVRIAGVADLDSSVQLLLADGRVLTYAANAGSRQWPMARRWERPHSDELDDLLDPATYWTLHGHPAHLVSEAEQRLEEAHRPSEHTVRAWRGLAQERGTTPEDVEREVLAATAAAVIM